jgi:uncharacterized protein (DUF362 family)
MDRLRRRVVRAAGVLLPSVLFNPFGIFRSLFAPEGRRGERRAPRPNRFVRDGKALVSIVGGESVDAMVRAAVALLGGIERLEVAGKTVFIKPNVVSDEPPPTTTNPAVVGAVVALVRAAGAARVIVGDMSGLSSLPTRKNLEATGIERAARAAGAEVIDLDDPDWVEVPLPAGGLLERVHVARPVYEADLLINLPVVKTHARATYSICLKNLVGVTHPRYRPYRVNAAKWPEVVAEVNRAIHPDLNIIDATTIMVAGGPHRGTPQRTGLILASGDRVAGDVAGLALIKRAAQWDGVTGASVWQQRQIRHAQQFGLGVGAADQMALALRRIDGDAAAFDAAMAFVERTLRDG